MMQLYLTMKNFYRIVCELKLNAYILFNFQTYLIMQMYLQYMFSFKRSNDLLI
jgi:hypothetical protein